ncbi:hypothetical protein [Asticcacaulis endophyticus]|uniref:Uncharacterized protein n=1 Tax=Asticcacaulis endophyticus TaxID=1395890 RepID=A0A918PTB2_9CAUL|nr:hypothetical protein [Asticcacaulis endophyticus]GGZ22001.1 hypothetical protein GCM10011273_03510 [Asticcacaulis endophyticus]
MNDMTAVITPKSDQWNADDFLSGPRTFTIRGVKINGGQEQPVNISLEGTDKFYRPCKSMSRVLVSAWGADATAYVGRSLTLYTDPKVKWGGMEVGGIRISHMSHIDGKLQLALTATKGQRKPHTVTPLVANGNQTAQVQSTAKPKKTPADWRTEIDALSDMAAIAVWLNDFAGMKTHDSQAARDVYAYAETRAQQMVGTTSDDSFDMDTATDDDFPGDRATQGAR